MHLTLNKKISFWLFNDPNESYRFPYSFSHKTADNYFQVNGNPKAIKANHPMQRGDSKRRPLCIAGMPRQSSGGPFPFRLSNLRLNK